MSSQSLRDILDAELAALSDCDDDELYEEDLELSTTSYTGTATVEDSPFSSDVTDKTRSLDEWQLLIDSSEQAERRFQSMSVILSDGFYRAEKHSLSEAESAIGIQYQASSNGSNHDPTISWYLDKLASACIEDESLLPNDLTPNMGYVEVLEDENLRAEVIELMNSMIEAVLSSAPTVRAPLLQLQLIPQAVDWSLLPKILQDDIVLDDTVVSFSELNNAAGITDDGEDDEQSKNIIERKIQLKMAQDNLLLISNRANEVALQRKAELLERKRCMEVELGLLKKETSSVMIQSKWREYKQRCTYLIQLDCNRKKIAFDLLENVRREEIEKEVFEEKLRHKRLQEKKIAEEVAQRKEEERVEEMVRVEKELAIQHAKEVEVKVEIERLRMILEEERRREAIESKMMHTMDSESKIIEEHQRRIDNSCVACKECSAKLQHKHTIRVRYRSIPAVDVMHIEEIEHLDVVSESTGRRAIVEEVLAEVEGEGEDEVKEEVDGVESKIEKEDEHHMLILPLGFMKDSGKSITRLPTRSSFSQLYQPLTEDTYHELQSGIHIMPVRDLIVEKVRMSCKQPEEVASDTCLLLSENEQASQESLTLQIQVQVLSSDDSGDEEAGFTYPSENSIDPPLQECILFVPGDKNLQVAIAAADIAVAVTPPGVARLQAVWRSKKARRRIKNALRAARYQDDELDDLFGAEDLNMDETLLSYEDYLAPISLCGGWQPSLPHPEQTENLHGTRMVKALAGGWMVGGIETSIESSEMKNEREDNDDYDGISSNHSLGGPLVYGDHRRRRQSVKDGLSEQILKHLSFSDNPNKRSTALIESPKRELFHSSSSSTSSSSSLPRVVTSGGSNQRPHTAFTETSFLSESTAGVLPVQHPSHIIGDERVTSSTGGPVQRVNTVSDVRYKSKAYGVSNRGSSADVGETTMSKGGGGAAGMSNSTGSGRGRGGMGRGGGRHKTGRKSVPPAWALTGPLGGEEGSEY